MVRLRQLRSIFQSGLPPPPGGRVLQPSEEAIADVFRASPEQARPLFALHHLLPRGDGPRPVADRELIAAFGVGPDLIDALVSDIDSAPVD